MIFLILQYFVHVSRFLSLFLICFIFTLFFIFTYFLRDFFSIFSPFHITSILSSFELLPLSFHTYYNDEILLYRSTDDSRSSSSSCKCQCQPHFPVLHSLDVLLSFFLVSYLAIFLLLTAAVWQRCPFIF